MQIYGGALPCCCRYFKFVMAISFVVILCVPFRVNTTVICLQFKTCVRVATCLQEMERYPVDYNKN